MLKQHNCQVPRFKSVGLVWTCPHGQWGGQLCMPCDRPPAACRGWESCWDTSGCMPRGQSHPGGPQGLVLRLPPQPVLVLGGGSPLLLDGEVWGSGTAWQGALGGQRHCAPGVPARLPSPETKESRTDPLVPGQANAWRNFLGGGVVSPRRAVAAEVVFQEALEMPHPCNSLATPSH